jgi:hypothetical protein
MVQTVIFSQSGDETNEEYRKKYLTPHHLNRPILLNEVHLSTIIVPHSAQFHLKCRAKPSIIKTAESHLHRQSEIHLPIEKEMSRSAAQAAGELLREARTFQLLSMREQIRAVIRGDQKEYRCSFGLALTEIDAFVRSLNGELTTCQTNGWDWDIWRRYKVNGKLYLLHHYGWGNKTRFMLDPDVDEESNDDDDDENDDHDEEGDSEKIKHANVQAPTVALPLPDVESTAFGSYPDTVLISAHFNAIQGVLMNKLDDAPSESQPAAKRRREKGQDK